MSSPAAIQFSNAHRSVKTRTAPGISRGELTRDAILTLTTSTLHPQTQSTSHYVLPISDKPAYERDPDHRSYVKSLYRRYLNNSLNWVVRRDIWRQRAIEIRAEFERNRWVDRSLPGGFVFAWRREGSAGLKAGPRRDLLSGRWIRLERLEFIWETIPGSPFPLGWPVRNRGVGL